MLMDLGVGYLFGRFEMYEIVRRGGEDQRCRDEAVLLFWHEWNVKAALMKSTACLPELPSIPSPSAP